MAARKKPRPAARERDTKYDPPSKDAPRRESTGAMDYLHRVLEGSRVDVKLIWFRAYGKDERGKPCSMRIKAVDAAEVARLAPRRAFKGFVYTHCELDPD